MNRGEIWLVNLDPTLGAEIRKTRPVIVVNSDSIGALPIRLVAPITELKGHFQGTFGMSNYNQIPQMDSQNLLSLIHYNYVVLIRCDLLGSWVRCPLKR